MHQIEPIDDYIEPQLIIQAKAHEIESLTRNGDWDAAFKSTLELIDAAEDLKDWLIPRMMHCEK